MTLSRRRFLKALGGLAVARLLPVAAQDWDHETPEVTQMRQHLETFIGDFNMSLDFRGIDADQNELFRIQINAANLQPVASCFKAFVLPYYFLHTPRDEWAFAENSLIYSMAVHSNNRATGLVLDEVGKRVRGNDNAIVKFNNFLQSLGIQNGLHSWNWEGSPTEGMADPRFAPSLLTGRVVHVHGESFTVDNVFTAEDLARGHDFITRGEFFTRSEQVREVVRLTKTVLSIPSATTGYQSPLERAFPPGYTGKDGILPASDVSTGRVVNDAGALRVGDRTYIVSFMSAGESESVALDVLDAVVSQIGVFEQSHDGVSLEVLFNGA